MCRRSIHFDPPAEDSTYLHRSGRTARAGATGTVVSLLEGSQKKDAKKLQRGIGIDEPITEPRFGALLAPAPAPKPARAPHSEASRESRTEGSSRQVVIAAPKKADRSPRKATATSAPASVGGAGDGAVKFFNSGRGYGFITPDGGGKDLFVHFSVIVNDGFKTLDNGARVAYQVREGRNGAEAFDVRVVG